MIARNSDVSQDLPGSILKLSQMEMKNSIWDFISSCIWDLLPPCDHLGNCMPHLYVFQVCGEKNRFEKLMEYFTNEDSNIDFMVRNIKPENF